MLTIGSGRWSNKTSDNAALLLFGHISLHRGDEKQVPDSRVPPPHTLVSAAAAQDLQVTRAVPGRVVSAGARVVSLEVLV